MKNKSKITMVAMAGLMVVSAVGTANADSVRNQLIQSNNVMRSLKVKASQTEASPPPIDRMPNYYAGPLNLIKGRVADYDVHPEDDAFMCVADIEVSFKEGRIESQTIKVRKFTGLSGQGLLGVNRNEESGTICGILSRAKKGDTDVLIGVDTEQTDEGENFQEVKAISIDVFR